MKIYLPFFAMLLVSSTVFSQMQTVQLNPRKLQFDGGRELPAEKSFLVSVDAENAVSMITMQLANGDFDKYKVLYENKWRRKENDMSTVAVLPNLYKLRSGKDYQFRFLYYKKLGEGERRQIRSMLESTANALIESNIVQKDDRYKFSSSPSDIMDYLNKMVEDGMVNYESRSGSETPKFSEVLENLLSTMAKSKFSGDNSSNNMENKMQTLQKQVANEIEMIANQYQYVLYDNIVIPDYPVEKKNNVLALNVGYAGVYNKGTISDVDYFSGAYAGVSFPLGNRVFNGNFWNNASLSAGVFLKDFKANDSTKFSGPVVNRPIYVALGYRVFNYLKIHGGTTVVEETNQMNNNKSITFKPFVGLSIEMNLWLGFDKK